MEPEQDIFEQWAEERGALPWYKKSWNRLSNWWSNARHYPRVFWVGVKNLAYWAPIVWRDRHWDQSYIFIVLQHKLKAQADWIQTRGTHLNAPTDARNMRTCVSLINRVNEDYYSLEYADYMKSKFWFEDAPGQPGFKELHSLTVEDMLDQYFDKYPRVYNQVMRDQGPLNIKPHEMTREHIAMSIAHINHDRARKLLFKIMEQNIERWWD